jgi:hypothetical protein
MLAFRMSVTPRAKQIRTDGGSVSMAREAR